MYVPMKPMLDRANAGGYAIMSINCFNLETARTVIRAAELENAPIIVNIHQEHFLNHCDSSIIAPLVRTLADSSPVDVSLSFDHGEEFEYLKKAIDDGFASVMVDASRFDLEGNINLTKKVVEYAHPRNVSVEGEIGNLGGTEGGNYTAESMYTDPQEAKRFFQESGIDALAVSIGTSHGDYLQGEVPEFDFDRLKEIKRLTGAPLVLHGTSGSGDWNIKNAVKYGMNKINVGTDFMNANRDSTAKILKENPAINYYQLIHRVETESIEIIRYYIGLSGSSNKQK